MDKCAFCDKDIYIQVERNLMPVLAPTTYEAALRDELINITGKAYVLFPKSYCPVCGAKIHKDMIEHEIISSLRDQARDKEALANGDTDSIFAYDAKILHEAANLLEKLVVRDTTCTKAKK